MNISKLYTFLLLGVLFLFACENELKIEGKAPGVISFSKPGHSKVISYDVGEMSTVDIWISKGGLTSGTSKARIVIDKPLLDSLNKANGTNYVLLPEDFYKIENSLIEIPKDSDLVKGTVSFDPVKIKNKIGYDKEFYALPLRLISENGFPVFNKERSEMLLTFVVSEPTVKILNTGFFQMDLTDPNVKSLDVNIGVDFSNKWDIEIVLASNQSAVDAYNLANKTNYSLMPSEVYQHPKNIRIAKGETSYTASYKINKDKLLPGNYLLPIQIGGITSKLDGKATDVIKFEAKANITFAFSKKGDKISKKNGASNLLPQRSRQRGNGVTEEKPFT